MKLNATYIFIALNLLFLLFSFSIYLQPLNAAGNKEEDKEKVAAGRLVWQKYNCQSCHQLYGLGGYLGPDLTNIISNKSKGEIVVRALLPVGVKQMPAFNLSDNETDLMISFLKATDASGIADPRNFSTNPYGMIKENETR